MYWIEAHAVVKVMTVMAVAAGRVGGNIVPVLRHDTVICYSGGFKLSIIRNKYHFPKLQSSIFLYSCILKSVGLDIKCPVVQILCDVGLRRLFSLFSTLM